MIGKMLVAHRQSRNTEQSTEASAQGTVKHGENRLLEWRIVLTLMVYRRKDLSAKVRGRFSLV